MRTNEAGKNLIKSFEGLRLKAYRCPAGVPTVGWGSTLGVTMGMTITQAQAEELFDRDLVKFENAVTSFVHVPLNENQFSALVSLCYNIGPGNFSKSTLVKLLNKADYDGACQCFAQWNRANGKVMKGLTTRRAAEAKLFNTPVSNKPVPEPAKPAPSGSGIFNTLFKRLRGKA
jgi:lysozyme